MKAITLWRNKLKMYVTVRTETHLKVALAIPLNIKFYIIHEQ